MVWATERINQRAAGFHRAASMLASPPLNRKLVLDAHQLRASPYAFNED